MDVAREEALGGTADGTVVLTDEQTGGRGRFGRAWVSPAGQNVYLTLVLRPSTQRLRMLSVVTPLAISLAIGGTTSLKPTIKWPNDVRIHDRKIAGVLIENEFSGSDLMFSLVGVGLNVNFDPSGVPEIADIATSIMRETGKEWPRELLVSAFLNDFERLHLEANTRTVHSQWKSRLDTLGRPISVVFREQIVEGVAEDVDEYGDLLVRRADGSLETVVAGEVSLRPSRSGA
jgi:BirA family biotin operon repressor/biotin-[acetyl-CoA-carboxylase] ligase